MLVNTVNLNAEHKIEEYNGKSVWYYNIGKVNERRSTYTKVKESPKELNA